MSLKRDTLVFEILLAMVLFSCLHNEKTEQKEELLNVVFNAGTIWWAQGLSSPPGHVLPAHKYDKNARPQGVDPRVQRMMTNMLNRFVK